MMHSITLVFLSSAVHLAAAFLPNCISYFPMKVSRGCAFEQFRYSHESVVSSSLVDFGTTKFRHSRINLQCAKMSEGKSEGKRVAVIGAGPAGLAVAHYLLKRNEGYDITIIDGRPDPRSSAEASIRSYSLGLGVRGRTALKKLPAYVWQGVREKGVECDRFVPLGSNFLSLLN